MWYAGVCMAYRDGGMWSRREAIRRTIAACGSTPVADLCCTAHLSHCMARREREICAACARDAGAEATQSALQSPA